MECVQVELVREIVVAVHLLHHVLLTELRHLALLTSAAHVEHRKLAETLETRQAASAAQLGQARHGSETDSAELIEPAESVSHLAHLAHLTHLTHAAKVGEWLLSRWWWQRRDVAQVAELNKVWQTASAPANSHAAAERVHLSTHASAHLSHHGLASAEVALLWQRDWLGHHALIAIASWACSAGASWIHEVVVSAVHFFFILLKCCF